MATTEATPIQFIEVIDLRPFDLDTGKLVPIEPDACNRCARCGRLHAVVYIVEKDGKRYEVGATCCKYLFGWQPSYKEVKNAEAVARDKAIRATVEKIAQPLFEQITRKSVPAPSYVRFARGLKGYDYGFAAEGAGIWIETTDRVSRHPSQIVLLASDLERFANQWKRRQVCSWVASNYSQWPKAKQKKVGFGILDLLGLLVDAHE